MKKITGFIMLMSMVLISCHESKKSTMDQTTSTGASQPKALLLDGEWEANYIMNTPKAFEELYAMKKPGIVFNSTEKKISGSSGCNNFMGSFTVDGNKLSISDNVALTRKMCPDMTGEELFINTLKKVNGYSVTEQGKTLNLIMGDMAIMRLTRK